MVTPWAGVSAQTGLEDFDDVEHAAAERYGAETAELVRRWRSLLEDLVDADEATQIERVNAFFNRHIHFQDDLATWGKEDFWATPLEALDKGAGDCEDFSIAKYVSLRKLGIPDQRLRLFYVRARIGGPASGLSQAHMVLGYFPEPEAEPKILDNLVTRIEPASQRDDLTPIFSFNAEGLWAEGAEGSQANPSARLSRWRRVLEQLDEYGLDLDRSARPTNE